MNWKLPNQLTVGRIAISAAFFVLVGLYDQGAAGGQLMLNVAFWLYIFAGVTDVLDGYLARKMNITSAFGRIADPFVDKVLVVGAFAMLTGSNFVLEPSLASEFEWSLPHWITGHMASAIQAWMVVAIVGREFIVSAVRGYSESRGVEFPATPAGKIKMFCQSFAICSVLYQLAHQPAARWAICMKVISVWVALVVTVVSGLAYVGRTMRLLRSDE